MLPAAARLRHRSDFARTVRTGVRVGRSSLVVHALPAATVEANVDADAGAPVQVGFVVGRGVGSAVARNRVRRRLRHLVAARLDELTDRYPGGSLVVRALPPAATCSSLQLGADFDGATRVLAHREAQVAG